MGNNFDVNLDRASTYSSSSRFTFTLSGATSLLVGLIDFDGRDAGQALGLGFSIANGPTTLLSEAFTSLAAANGFFKDHPLTFAAGSGVVDLLVTFTMTSSTAQGAAFDYVVASNGIATPVPEASTCLFMLVGLFFLLATCRDGRRHA